MSQSQIGLTRLLACITLVLCSSVASRSQNSHSNGPTTVLPDVSSLDLSDFGAVGDGITDDGPALQSALDALAERGGKLFVPAGHYLITTPVAKDFSGLASSVTIDGVASSTMPAPPNASGYELASGLNLTSEIIPATGESQIAISVTGLENLLIRHLAFVGRDGVRSDAYATLYLTDINQATIHHCEFYGLSTFGVIPNLGGGNIIRAIRTQMTIEESSFLGCTANSGANAPVVENIEWRGLTVSNSIFLDYGLRDDFFSKTGFGAPLSWINLANAAAPTPASPRREVVVREVFLDEGGWIGITAKPSSWPPPVIALIDLIYISGLRMNVSNFSTSGHLFSDVRNILIENSHYGWSHNADSAIDVRRVENVILDELTCIDHADRLRADNGTERFTVINSDYGELASLAKTTTVLETQTLEEDPVQYVRQQFIDTLNRPPDPAAHFYWSDLLIKCALNSDCNQKREALADFLESNPQSNFAINGTVIDENGEPLSGVAVTLTGSQTVATLTDETGSYRFSHLPTSGNYTLIASKRHYWFVEGSESFNHPVADLHFNLTAVRNRHKISGRVTKPDGSPVAAVKLVLGGSFVTTDTNGFYSFTNLLAGDDYTVVPLVDELKELYFTPVSMSFQELDADQVANFLAKPLPRLLTAEGSDAAIVLGSVTFLQSPFSIFTAVSFGSDNVRRIMLFARNLENVNDRAEVEVQGEDAEGNIYPLEIECLSDVVGQSWLKQLNIKLSPALPPDEDIWLSIKVAGLISNKARIRIRG